jgi:cellulose biosynthesis protein BcsQ
MGTVITFYSYKGGVGRSMAMANVGALLASWGKKVLMIDWDLEAPGLENYFFNDNLKINEITKKEGLINLLVKRRQQADFAVSQIEWSKILTSIPFDIIQKPVSGNRYFPSKSHLDLLTAGQRDENYIKNVRLLDYDKFYEENNGGQFLEDLREYWISNYDFVLIDSRTGLTDSSGVCSIQMPDILVLLFTATEQGFKGTLKVAADAARGQEQIVYDRYRLKLLPVPTRFDSTEFKLQKAWLDRFTQDLKDTYTTWVPDYPKDKDINIDHRSLLELTKLPYIPYFSYGEKLPVQEEGTTSPQSLGYAFETLTALLAHKLEGAKLLVENRSEFVRRAKEGLSPDDEIASNKEDLGEKLVTQARKIKWAIAAAVAVALLVITYAFRDVLLPGKDNGTDSLQYQLRVSEFINQYKAMDTTNIATALTLNETYFKKGLDKDTSKAIIDIRAALDRMIINDLELGLPIFYQQLGMPGFNPGGYFPDTVTFMGQKVLSSALVSEYFNVGNYRNTIENDSLTSFKPDSLGFSLAYVETGNYHIRSSTQVDSTRSGESDFRIPVSMRMNTALKITEIAYSDPLPSIAKPAKTERIRVDLFVVGEGATSLNLYMVESIYQQLQRNSPYQVRKRGVLSDARNSSSAYRITENQIRYNKGEEQYARELELMIAKATGQKFKLMRTTTNTLNYLSVFIKTDGSKALK